MYVNNIKDINDNNILSRNDSPKTLQLYNGTNNIDEDIDFIKEI